MASTLFKVLRISGIPFDELIAAERDAMAQRLVSASESSRWWSDSAIARFSVAKGVYLLDRYVSGILTQQHNLDRHIYNDAKVETQSRLDSYEDRLFLLDLREGRLILEWRQFRAKPPLSLPLMVTRMERVLRDTVAEDRADSFLALEDIHGATSKDEFLSIFYSQRVLSVNVAQVGRVPVPEDVQLVNPIPHLEGAMRALLIHDAELGAIDDLSAEIDSNGQGDLRRSALIRGAMHSGEPERVEYQEFSGAIRVRRKNEKGVIAIELPVLTSDSPEARLRMASRIIEAVDGIDLGPPPPQTPRPTDNLELFDG